MRNNKTAELLRLDTLLEQQQEYLKEQRLRTGFHLHGSLKLGVEKAATAQNTLFDAAFVGTKRQRDEQDQLRGQRAKVAKPFASPNPSARSSPFESFDGAPAKIQSSDEEGTIVPATPEHRFQFANLPEAPASIETSESDTDTDPDNSLVIETLKGSVKFLGAAKRVIIGSVNLTIKVRKLQKELPSQLKQDPTAAQDSVASLLVHRCLILDDVKPSRYETITADEWQDMHSSLSSQTLEVDEQLESLVKAKAKKMYKAKCADQGYQYRDYDVKDKAQAALANVLGCHVRGQLSDTLSDTRPDSARATRLPAPSRG
ncbi:hypothetical protein HDU89_005658 [Geranomyces variabilis]|nr:hypothetical protein HDU89_005658 [Geranomyces variabilis]